MKFWEVSDIGGSEILYLTKLVDVKGEQGTAELGANDFFETNK